MAIANVHMCPRRFDLYPHMVMSLADVVVHAHVQINVVRSHSHVHIRIVCHGAMLNVHMWEWHEHISVTCAHMVIFPMCT